MGFRDILKVIRSERKSFLLSMKLRDWKLSTHVSTYVADVEANIHADVSNDDIDVFRAKHLDVVSVGSWQLNPGVERMQLDLCRRVAPNAVGMLKRSLARTLSWLQHRKRSGGGPSKEELGRVYEFADIMSMWVSQINVKFGCRQKAHLLSRFTSQHESQFVLRLGFWLGLDGFTLLCA